MRFIYTILLAMIIFNGMLIVFSSYFPAESTTFGAAAVDPSDAPATEGYRNIGSQSWIADAVLAGAGVLAGAAVLALVTHSVIPIGAGCFIAFIAGLWVGISKPLTGIISQFSISGLSLYSLFVICLGIIVTASVIEMFVQQKEAG